MRLIFPSILCSLLLGATGAAQAVPLEIAHQGELIDASGPVTDQVTFTFRLFTSLTGGTAVWEEIRTVDVVNGNYLVLLGSESDIAPTLLAEPSLYLEVEVFGGGGPLEPRQPVASVPYAVAAGTAENVVGGVADVTEVTVGGQTVIDTTGSWNGGPGTVPWSDLRSIPAGFADGVDNDALGGLSCLNGESAVWDTLGSSWVCGASLAQLSCADGEGLAWNGALGRWGCASDTVALERLDGTGAQAGDVVSFGASGPEWTASEAATGCTLIEQDVAGGRAELLCGTERVFLAVRTGYLDMDLAYGYGCGVRLDGTLACWWSGPTGPSTLPSGILLSSPVGTFQQVSTGFKHACALRDSGSIVCWGDEVDGNTSPPSGTFVEVDVAPIGNLTCGRRTSGSVECWGTTTPLVLSGSFVDVEAGNGFACGRDSAGILTCAGSNDNGRATPPTSPFTQFQLGDPGGCGVTTGGQLECWGHSSLTADAPSGVFSATSVGWSNACALDISGHTTCWGGYAAQPPAEAVLRGLATAHHITCGFVGNTPSVACWGDGQETVLSPP